MNHLARIHRIGLSAVLLALVSVALPGPARADVAQDQINTISKPRDDRGRAEWRQKLSGSTAELSSYIGSGSFYASGYRDPYVSTALFVRPTYDLGTRFKLSANARLYLEEEFTQPDNPNGRHFSPSDIWFWLSARELHRWERSRLRLGGVLRVVVPISYESRYSHMVTGAAAGLSLGRTFDFGPSESPDRRWNLVLSLNGVFTKYVYTSDLRGNAPGDTSGCRSFLGAGAAGGSASGGPSASESDRCGGPVNTSYSVTSSGLASLTRAKWSLSVILVVGNQFRYSVPRDSLSPITATDVGRTDTTWGVVSLSYSLTEHLAVSVGMSSYQPALDSRYQSLRFPFFDLSGGANANNYTQAFVSLSGTI